MIVVDDPKIIYLIVMAVECTLSFCFGLYVGRRSV